MPSLDEIKKQRELSNAFLAGERILGIKFRHNSRVAFVSTENIRLEGWIVSVRPIEPEPIYTVECCDGTGDEEVLESKLEFVAEPREM